MKAELLLHERYSIGERAFIELVIWQVPKPVHRSPHSFKYRFALIEDGVCTLRYDNEAGKGDHRHIGDRELPYVFYGLDRLIADFRADVRARMRGKK